MTDDKLERIRELQLQIAQWERVHGHEMQQEVSSQTNRRGQLTLAMRTAILGSIPSVVWLICWVSVVAATSSWFVQILGTMCALFVLGLVTAGAARACGLFSHWWFSRSPIRTQMTTITLTLAADAFLFWWVTVIAGW